MNYNDFTTLTNAYYRKLASTSLQFKRSLFEKINWDVRLIGIKGARGVGKTTMLLQRIKEKYPDVTKAFYASLDNIWFNDNSLEELVEFLYTRGVEAIFLDEVHKCPDWAQRIKNIYDDYPDLQIVYTGSAMLVIDNSQSDLSRRQTLHTLYGLSFREYLEYEGLLKYDIIPLEEVLNNHVAHALQVTSQIKVLEHFERYLSGGYYPYYKEAGKDYYIRINEVSNIVIESDLPAVEKVTFETVQKAKKLLAVISKSLPFQPIIDKLANQLQTTRDHCLKMLYALDKAALLFLLGDKVKDYKHLTNPKKIYLDNTNLMYALSENVLIGTIRETFFANQVKAAGELTLPKAGDFMINGKYLLEVGGKKKTFEQIADLPNSFLAVDDTETGSGNRIPLWMFGMMY